MEPGRNIGNTRENPRQLKIRGIWGKKSGVEELSAKIKACCASIQWNDAQKRRLRRPRRRRRRGTGG